MKRYLLAFSFCLGICFAFGQVKKTKAEVTLIRGPYLQVVTPTSIVIRWRTDAACRSRVSYGAAADRLDQTTTDINLVTEHQIKLTDLLPYTKYYYSIGALKDTLQTGKENYFYTLPPAGQEGDYRIGVFGDCGTNTVNQRNTRDQFVKRLGDNYLNSWILLGDNAYNDGTDAEFQAKFFNIYKDALLKKYPLYTSPGNHDYHDADFTADHAQNTHQTAYYQNFSMPLNGEAGGKPSHSQSFYSFDIGNIHFISLDSYGKEENQYYLYDVDGLQVKWVKKDLAANQNKGWVVAFWHHPPYTMGSHNSDKESELVHIRENFIKVLEDAGVDLVLCGHSHGYERSKLMRGYYGMNAEFDPKYLLSKSSGKYDGSPNSAPYIKATDNKGTVYVVSGSAGVIAERQVTYPHNALPYANALIEGACLLEVRGNRLDLEWICADGKIGDRFTMMKDVNKKTVIHLKKGESTVLTASYIGDYVWTGTIAATRSVTITPKPGKSIYKVHDHFGYLQDIFEINAD
ncbi:purple acid phosphatase family protein [Mucilaginibacter sp. AW1-3]